VIDHLTSSPQPCPIASVTRSSLCSGHPVAAQAARRQQVRAARCRRIASGEAAFAGAAFHHAMKGDKAARSASERVKSPASRAVSDGSKLDSRRPASMSPPSGAEHPCLCRLLPLQGHRHQGVLQ